MNASEVDSRVWLQGLLDRLPDGVIAFDRQGLVVWINPAARLMLHASAADVVGTPIERWLPEVARATEQPAHAAVDGQLRPDQPAHLMNARRMDGQPAPMEVTAVTLPAGDEQVWMCVCRDRRAAERVESAKHEFLTMASHELRTPLTSLQGSLAMLADGSLGNFGDDAQRMLRLALVNSERLTRLVNDILEFGKLRAGAFELQLREIDLLTALGSAIESIEPLMQQARVGIDIASETQAAPVYADPSRLDQVLVNLLSNALRHAPADSTISVEVRCRGERVRVDIVDQGKGVGADLHATLFRPFAQSKAAPVRGGAGSGLGLSISRNFMEMMNGTIGLAKQREGEGARFWIDLPLHQEMPSTFGDLISGFDTLR
jgi:PAS domain S-box-containing protein